MALNGVGVALSCVLPVYVCERVWLSLEVQGQHVVQRQVVRRALP